MNFSVREGKFDVVIAAGPRVSNWPSIGARAIAALCGQMGLKAAILGGEDLSVRGVIPLPGTGGIVLAEDVQRRIHRIHARAIVKIAEPSSVPEPFPGWRSQGLIPIETATRLRKESPLIWDPCTVILGTGNPALRFGSSLLESGVDEVFCVESFAQWGAKRFAGWEVERRRFEMAGGKIIEAKPMSLSPKSALLWELRVQDSLGIRVLDVGRVVSAGPFVDISAVREYPPGSLLFELEHSAAAAKPDHVEGWMLEEERAKWLASRIIKALVSDLGDKREGLESVQRRAKSRIKRYMRHREEPFTPSYQGKWVAPGDAREMRAYTGVPKTEQKVRFVASLECFEEIPCDICHLVCPEDAIDILKLPRQREDLLILENKCTACGLCVQACPSSAITMVHEQDDRSTAMISIPWRGAKPWSAGELATLLNRRGESMGSGRIVKVDSPPGSVQPNPIQTDVKQILQVELPSHLVWEARNVKRARAPVTEDEAFLNSVARSSFTEERVEITLNGEKRLVRDRIPLLIALFDTGRSRAEDILFCADGSCGLCQLGVDGVRKLACQTEVHRGMAVRLGGSEDSAQDVSLCPCLGLKRDDVLDRARQAQLQSMEAVLSMTHVGEGKCHGLLCMGALQRILLSEGLDVSQWIDWRFPWSEWVLNPS